MPLEKFGYVADLPGYTTDHDPPLTEPEDGAFKNFLDYQIGDMPLVMPYGIVARGGGGISIFSGTPRISLTIPQLWVRRPDSPDNSNIVGTSQELFREIRLARRRCRGQLWVNFWDIESLSWKKTQCVIPLPEWAEEANGAKFKDVFLFGVTLELENVGLNMLDTEKYGEGGYKGGEPSPPPTSGSPKEGALGWGALGWGALGDAENFPPEP